MSTSDNHTKRKSFFIASSSFRLLFIVVFLFIEIGAIVTLTIIAAYFNIGWLQVLFYICEFLSIICAIGVINSRMDPSYKVIWLFFMIINSVIGALFYILFANKKFTKKEKALNKRSLLALNQALDNKEAHGLAHKIDPEQAPTLYNLATYIRNRSFTDLYANTYTKYFPWGELAFPMMLEKLRSAKHFIFLEYFIIEHGKFWNPIEAILIEKAKKGLDVRVIYDDLGCVKTLPAHYDEYLIEHGIKCIRYAPLKPILDIRMNNRDHRKIMVIDGHTGFTGGINIADEYINEVVRFGKWKDNAIMLQGDGVFGLTSLFLATWIRLSKDEALNYHNYLPSRFIHEIPPIKVKGYVAPYGSIPYTYETVGLNIYIMLCYRARKTLNIATPYLLPNSELENAICQAAKNGVRVRLLMPHIPDKKAVFEVSRSYCRNLLKSNVEIYEYTPGFVHAKMVEVDGLVATVGTINFDYRSLFLHSENGVLLYGTECIKDITKDFEETFKVSHRVTLEEFYNISTLKRIKRFILRIFAPLM